MHNTLCNNNHKNCIGSKLLDLYNLTLDKPENKDEIIKILDNHIQAMLYNISSIASVTALLDEKSKIEMKHIDFIKHYITKQCTKHEKNKQQGGSFPAEYFGYDSGAYTEANYGGVNYNDFRIEPDKLRMGLIAQEVELIIPEVVDTNEKTTMKSIAYSNMIGLLVEAIKELNNKIINLENKII
jgi:hypothetical protein